MRNSRYKTNGEITQSDFWDGKAVEIEQVVLPLWVKDSFLGGIYKTLRTTELITLFRAYGGAAKKLGSFTTTEPPIDISVVEKRCAIKNEFDNSLYEYIEIQVPEGTILQVGYVAPQLANDNLPNIPLCQLKGGAVQALLPLDFFDKNPDVVVEKMKTPNFIRPIGAAALHYYAKTHDKNSTVTNLMSSEDA